MSSAGESSVRFWRVMFAGSLFIFGIILSSCGSIVSAESPATATPLPPDDGVIVVNVVDESLNPVSDGVVIRVTNSPQVDNNDNGGFRVVSCDSTQFITAWGPDREVAFVACDGQSASYQIQLMPLYGHDNTGYAWASANGNCSICHAGQFGTGYNELNEWLRSGHATVFDDRYFETMYRGINMGGISSVWTEWRVFNGQLIRIPPVVDSNYRGPGYRLDYPQQPGTCAYCHVPAAMPSSQMDVDLNPLFPKVADVRGEGVTCDVCHKVLNVALDDSNFPFADRPGVLSFRFLRPDINPFNIGPFSNILVPNRDSISNHKSTCSPIFSRSEFCAPCHYGKFGDMIIYNSYGEWKAGKYGDDPAEPDYKTCQDCHMSHMKADEENPPTTKRQACSESDAGFQNFDHNLMNFGMDGRLGREVPLMIRGAAKILPEFKYEPEKKNAKNSLNVIVRVRNTQVGHKFPTDSPLRHLVLLVDARDQLGTPLMQVDGERIPNWGGVGNVQMEYIGVKNYGGLPGKIFANLLVEEDTNISPTAAYWNETKFAWMNLENPELNSDNRLGPGETDKSDYFFTIPDAGEIKILITLIYRYAFFELMDQKDWNRPDVVVTSVECIGIGTAPESIECRTLEP